MPRALRTTLIAALALLTLPAAGQEAPPQALQEAVQQAFTARLSTPLTPHFAGQVELRIPGRSGIFSKKQAEMILANFLREAGEGEYRFDHTERGDETSLTIASWTAATARYRVQLLTIGDGDTTRIKQLKIEETK